MKNYLIITLLAVLCSCSYTIPGRCVNVHDGDTITLFGDDGNYYRIRLAEIDAPELSQPYGFDAKNYVQSLILNHHITVNIQTKDKYNREVGKIFCNGTYINELIVNAGFAWVYKKYNSGKIYNEELAAKNEHIGLWQDVNPIPPFIWRKNN